MHVITIQKLFGNLSTSLIFGKLFNTLHAFSKRGAFKCLNLRHNWEIQDVFQAMFYYTYVSKLKQSHIFVSLLPLLVTFVVTLHFHQNVNEFAFMTSTFQYLI